MADPESRWSFDLSAPLQSGFQLLKDLDALPGRIWKAMTARPTDFQAGSDFIPANAPLPGYDVREAMSALGEFAWVVACCNAIATDLSRLPLRASVGRGRKARKLDDHPVLQLLRKPASRTRRTLFRRQRILDLLLAGYNTSLKVYGARTQTPPASLLRMHPFRVKILPGTDGQISGYRYEGNGAVPQEYPWSAVLSASMVSWEDDPTGLYGQGLIRPLRRELATDLALQQSSKKSAEKGRPDGVISPSSKGDAAGSWTPEQVKAFQKSLLEIFSRAHGGYAVLGRPLEIERLGWSPIDLGTLEQRGFTRATILAVTGVPPVRMGLETANYATAKQQLEVYWGDVLQGLAELEDEEFTSLAQEFPDSREVEVWHDFSDVPALQDAQTARLSRVSTHIVNGMAPKAAYDYEGFEDAVLEAPPSTPSVPAAKPQKSWFAQTEEPDPEEAQAARWRDHIQRVHGPQERKLGVALAGLLRGQQRRLLARLEAMLPEDPVTPGMLNTLWPAHTEDQALATSLLSTVQTAVRAGSQEALAQLDVELDPSVSIPCDQQLTGMLVSINGTTRELVEELVDRGVLEGWTVQELRLMVGQHVGFGSARALVLARTEATRCLSRGARAASLATEASGIAVEEEWVSARDQPRVNHRKLDGICTAPAEPWEVDGWSVEFPAGFGDRLEDTHCRCAVIPRRKEG